MKISSMIGSMVVIIALAFYSIGLAPDITATTLMIISSTWGMVALDLSMVKLFLYQAVPPTV